MEGNTFLRQASENRNEWDWAESRKKGKTARKDRAKCFSVTEVRYELLSLASISKGFDNLCFSMRKSQVRIFSCPFHFPYFQLSFSSQGICVFTKTISMFSAHSFCPSYTLRQVKSCFLKGYGAHKHLSFTDSNKTNKNRNWLTSFYQRTLEWFRLKRTLRIIQIQHVCHGQGHLPLQQVPQIYIKYDLVTSIHSFNTKICENDYEDERGLV